MLHFLGCQRDVTKHASVQEYELAAVTAITVSVAVIQLRTAVDHKETPTPAEESRLTAGTIMFVTWTDTWVHWCTPTININVDKA